jgi:hypothetical protein
VKGEGVELGLDKVVGGDAEKVQSGGTLLTTRLLTVIA